MIKVIFAVGPRGEFGYKQKLPWGHCKADLKHFKEYTEGCILVMGKNTYDSLPSTGLPNRKLVVITSKSEKEVDRGIPCESLTVIQGGFRKLTDTFKFMDSIYPEDIVIIGGANLILDTLDCANEVSMSIIYNDECGPFDHDVSIPMGLLNTTLYGNFVRDKKFYSDSLELPTATFEIWKRRT